MHSVRFAADTTSDGIRARDFTIGDIPGVLWSPASGSDHAPLVLMGHGGGLHKKTPALMARAHNAVTAWGFHVVAIDAPGHGDRPRSVEDDQARDAFRQAHASGNTELFRSTSIRYMASLAERAVPEWQETLDALQRLPEIGSEAPIGYGGGISMGTVIGVSLTAIEPRIVAAIFGGGTFVDDSLIETARRIAVPVQFLLPWDDQDRQGALALFDAFAGAEKTLHANPGDHRTIRWIGVDGEFLPRHLGRAVSSAA